MNDLFIFLDALIFLHYKNINDIDWDKIVNNKVITLVICLSIINELDKKKHEGRQIIKERARKSLRFIESIMESQGKILRKEIRFKYLNEEPKDEYFNNFRLETKSGDDRLLCSILKYKDDSVNADVLLATDDTGLKLRAKNYNIKTLDIPDCYLNIEEDTTEKEIKVLKKELLLLKNKIPKLILTFDNNKNHKDFLILKNVAPKNYIDEEIEALKKRYPFVTKESEKPISIYDVIINKTPTKEDIEKYNEKMNEYYDKYKEYLNNLIDYYSIKGLTMNIQLYLVNNGNTPADDILLNFFYPDGFELFNDNYLNKKPSCPKEPKKPWNLGVFDLSQSFLGSSDINRYMNIIPTANIPSIQSNVSGNIINRTRSYEVKVNVKRIMHTKTVKLDPLYLKFNDFDTPKSFNINCKIIAHNIPKEQEETIHIKIKKEEKILDVNNFNIP